MRGEKKGEVYPQEKKCELLQSGNRQANKYVNKQVRCMFKDEHELEAIQVHLSFISVRYFSFLDDSTQDVAPYPMII